MKRYGNQTAHHDRAPVAPIGWRAAKAIARALRYAVVRGCFGLICLPCVAEELTLGIPITAVHGANEAFVYEFEAAAGEFVLVAIEQLGLDLKVRMVDPQGAVRVFDSPLFRDGSEYLLLDSPGGRFEIALRSEELTQAQGGHQILATLVADEASRMAWQAISDGGERNAEGGEEAWREALAAYERAAESWARLNEPRLEAESLFAAAAVDYWQLYGWRSAQVRADQAAAKFSALNRVQLAANARQLGAAALVEQALELGSQGEAPATPEESQLLFERAIDELESVRQTHEQLGSLYDLGLVTNNLGYTHYNMGALDQAVEYYDQAAALLQTAGETAEALKPRLNLAVVQVERGYLADAINALDNILDVLPAEDFDDYRSWALDALGGTQLLFGDPERALSVLADALELQQQIDDRQGQGRSLRRLGQTYFSLGEFELASDYLERALPIAEETDDARNREASLRSLGDLAFAQGAYQAALDHHRNALNFAVSSIDRQHLQIAIARDLRMLGQFEEASRLAASVSAGLDGSSSSLVATAELELGWLQLAQGDLDAASVQFENADQVFASLGMLSEHADARHGLAEVATESGALRRAVEFGAQALAAAERLRLKILVPERRAQLSATRRRYTDAQIERYMTLYRSGGAGAEDDLAAAFATSERARARSTTELIANSTTDPLVADVSEALVLEQASLIDGLAEVRHRRDLLLDAGSSVSDPALSLVVQDMANLETQLDLIEIQMRRTQRSDAVDVSALDFAAASAALGSETVLLQYELGDERSYVFVVHDGDLDVVELPPKAIIESAARDALRRLAVYSGAPGSAEPLNGLAALVIEPVVEQIAGVRSLAVALDGALQYVPFGVLPDARDGAPLLATRDIVEVPSMSAIVASRARRTHSGEQKTLAVFADPVFAADDPRMTAVASQAQTGAAGLLASRSSVTDGLDRLIASGYEAEQLGALVNGEQSLIARGFAASRQTLLNSKLSDYRFVHFATHGLIDSRYPGLSALALSSFDSGGRPQNGFLRLNDIQSLNLNADLVVLSACETALGREIRGEGLMGLTQGFITAGSRAVVASLWQVPDRATAELMTRMYTYLIDHEMPAAAALRQAQLDVAAERRWRDPYFWGGFVLIGDWR